MTIAQNPHRPRRPSGRFGVFFCCLITVPAIADPATAADYQSAVTRVAVLAAGVLQDRGENDVTVEVVAEDPFRSAAGTLRDDLIAALQQRAIGSMAGDSRLSCTFRLGEVNRRAAVLLDVRLSDQSGRDIEEFSSIWKAQPLDQPEEISWLAGTTVDLVGLRRGQQATDATVNSIDRPARLQAALETPTAWPLQNWLSADSRSPYFIRVISSRTASTANVLPDVRNGMAQFPAPGRDDWQLQIGNYGSSAVAVTVRQNGREIPLQGVPEGHRLIVPNGQAPVIRPRWNQTISSEPAARTPGAIVEPFTAEELSVGLFGPEQLCTVQFFAAWQPGEERPIVEPVGTRTARPAWHSIRQTFESSLIGPSMLAAISFRWPIRPDSSLVAPGASLLARGMTAYWRGDFRSARSALLSAYLNDTTDPRPLYFLALTYRRSGDVTTADRLLATAVAGERVFGRPDTGRFLERIQGRDRQWIEAARRSGRVRSR